MRLRLTRLATLAAASTAPPHAAAAQLRPTLAAQEQRSDAIEAALCAAADAEGDGYRPVFCPAQCGCAFDPNLVADCVEESPGTFVGIASGPAGSCGEGFGARQGGGADDQDCSVSDGDCRGDEVVRLTGVTSAGSLDTATCQASPPTGTAAPINSNDALECISQIETVVGQACTPAP